MEYKFRSKCCSECPWRKDVPTGRFPPAAFRRLAKSTYDMSSIVFTCHKSNEDLPVVCAGFLLRGALHNLTIRLEIIYKRFDLGTVFETVPLFRHFREMAVANGVDPADASLKECCSNQRVAKGTAWKA